MELQTDKFLKTRKIREAEEAARKLRMTKVPARPSFVNDFLLLVELIKFKEGSCFHIEISVYFAGCNTGEIPW